MTTNALSNRSCLIQNSQNVAWYGGASAASGVTGNGTNYNIVYSSAIINTGSALNTGTGKATLPVTGMYYLGYTCQVSGINGSGTYALGGLTINGAAYFLCECNPQVTVSSDKLTLQGSMIFYGTSGYEVNAFIRVYGQSAGSVTVEGGSGITYFTGVLLR